MFFKIKIEFSFHYFLPFSGLIFHVSSSFAFANSGVLVEIVCLPFFLFLFPMEGGAFTGEVRSGRSNMLEGPTNDLDFFFLFQIK